MRVFEMSKAELKFVLDHTEITPNELSPIINVDGEINQVTEAVNHLYKEDDGGEIILNLANPSHHVIMRSHTKMNVRAKVSLLKSEVDKMMTALSIDGEQVIIIQFDDIQECVEWVGRTYANEVDLDEATTETPFQDIKSIGEFFGALYAIDMCFYDYYESMLMCEDRDPIMVSDEDFKNRYKYEITSMDVRWQLPKYISLLPTVKVAEVLDDEVINQLVEKQWIITNEVDGQKVIGYSKRAQQMAFEIMYANPVDIGIQAMRFKADGEIEISTRFALITTDLNNHLIKLDDYVFSKGMDRQGFTTYLKSWFKNI